MKGAEDPYQGRGLIADPIHQYILYTRPGGIPGEATEQDLIDTAWVQRLRRVPQLQSARWVYPAAEHSRFQHSLGAMHLAGRLAQQLYPSLRAIFPDAPSAALIEELLRTAGLLHDVGHGPFGHFFDDNFLVDYELTHELLGQRIIREELADLLRSLRRSPNGVFDAGESIDPEWICYLMGKSYTQPLESHPRWLPHLKPLLSGVFTADNMDYVLRDSYMCGVAVGPDRHRPDHLLLVLLREGAHPRPRRAPGVHDVPERPLLHVHERLLPPDHARHRPAPQGDLPRHDAHRVPLRSPQGAPSVPASDGVDAARGGRALARRRGRRTGGALGAEWRYILDRKLKWRMSGEEVLDQFEARKGQGFLDVETVKKRVRTFLPPALRDVPFEIDMALQDPRPLNPLKMGDRQIYVYDSSTKRVSEEPLTEILKYLPGKVAQCRIFAMSHERDAELALALKRALSEEPPSILTNV